MASPHSRCRGRKLRKPSQPVQLPQSHSVSWRHRSTGISWGTNRILGRASSRISSSAGGFSTMGTYSWVSYRTGSSHIPQLSSCGTLQGWKASTEVWDSVRTSDEGSGWRWKESRRRSTPESWRSEFWCFLASAPSFQSRTPRTLPC